MFYKIEKCGVASFDAFYRVFSKNNKGKGENCTWVADFRDRKDAKKFVEEKQKEIHDKESTEALTVIATAFIEGLHNVKN